ncbi:MAG: glycine cleavage system protein GcvH [Elusimicrobiaceae bacterium]|nr:glycine cleavage system protein GcvH [Elusimicrobiaceae bacterium]
MFNAENCKFAKSHEWAHVEGDTATVGISDFAQHEISDIVFVELPKAGAAVEQGKACAVIESVKAASDFYAPVSGTVTEVNKALVDEPSLANKAPHGEGWFFKLKLSKPAELAGLMDFAAYQQSAGK